MEKEFLGLGIRTWLILAGSGLALLSGWIILRMALRLADQTFRIGCFFLTVIFILLIILAFAIRVG